VAEVAMTVPGPIGASRPHCTGDGAEARRGLGRAGCAGAACVRHVAAGALRAHPDGVSTQVYRLVRGPETFYLRLAEETDENLETDAELHRRLLALGVRVPQVVFVEPFDEAIGTSVAITKDRDDLMLGPAGFVIPFYSHGHEHRLRWLPEAPIAPRRKAGRPTPSSGRRSPRASAR
jgi:hypothetical protein